MDRGDMLAGISIIGTGAICLQVTTSGREQAHPRGAEGLLDILGHLAGQQLGSEAGLFSQGVDDPLPLGIRERCDLDADPVGPGLRPPGRAPQSPLWSPRWTTPAPCVRNCARG